MIQIEFSRISSYVCRAAVCVLILGLLAAYLNLTGTHESGVVRQFVAKFSLLNESSIPTWFSTAILLLAAALAFLAAQPIGKNNPKPTPFRLQWIILALIMLALSADEIAGVHQALSGPFRRLCLAVFGLYHPSMNPALIAAPLLGLLFLPFLRRLPNRAGVYFAIAGAIYLIGALGLEWLGSDLGRSFGKQAMVYKTIGFAEEILEIVGIVLFVHFLCRHLAFATRSRPSATTSVADTSDWRTIDSVPRPVES